MKYLKKVVLNNFQSHKYSVVEFDQGLNIIVGPSDTGKTAIIRGIKWVLYNEPSGDYFIREGENEASVILEFSNNVKIKRLRTRSKNAYILYNKEGDELVFEGFGNKVPQEIIDLISIEKISLDSNETNSINIGEQLEGAFLLSEKGSTRASAIGRLIGVNLIDDALKDTLKDTRNISIQKKILQDNIKKTEIELSNYEYLDNLQNVLIELENMKNLIVNKNTLKNTLIKNFKNYNSIKIEKNDLKNSLKELIEIDNLEKNILNLVNKNNKLDYYKHLKIKLYNAKEQIYFDENLIENLKYNDNIGNKIEQIIYFKDKLRILNILKTEKSNLEKEKENIIFIDENLKDLDSVNSNAGILEKKINKLKKLLISKENLILNHKSIDIGDKYMEKLYNINKINLIYEKLNDSITKIQIMLKFSMQINKLEDELKVQNNLLNIAKKDLNNNLKTYEELLKKNEICPLCLSLIDENKIEDIIEHYK